MSRRLTILAADDVEMNRRLLTRIVEHLGHEIVLVENGLAALEFCKKSLPDLILMDVMMPVMDGLEATRQIRTLLAGQWVPIIFLTAKAEQEDLLEGLRAGGDDYLTKPLDVSLLTAKINVMARIADMQQRIKADARQLSEYYRRNEAEQILAKHVLSTLTEHAGSKGTDVLQWIKPAVNFSGDVIAVARAPTGILHAVLADSTGHGLSAAISCLPAVMAFYAMTDKGFGINAIARETNAHLHRSLPIGRFVAAVFVAIDYAERIVSAWNGGMPNAMVMSESGAILQRFESKAPPLGVLSNEEFDSNLAVYRWVDDVYLMLCSDGLTEACNPDGEEFGEVRLADAMIAAGTTNNKIDAIRTALEQHAGDAENQDDVSVLIVPCQFRPNSRASASRKEPSHTELANWQIRITFGPRQLREDNCMPVLLGWLNQIGLDEDQFGDVLLVLTELFNNALDHGVLRLPSVLKSAAEGFVEFVNLRQSRLAVLESGTIEVGMTYRVDADHAILLLSVQDSGPGFDFNTYQSMQLSEDARRTHGRGIPLVRRVCGRVSYLGNGNHVEVEYALN